MERSRFKPVTKMHTEVMEAGRVPDFLLENFFWFSLKKTMGSTGQLQVSANIYIYILQSWQQDRRNEVT